MNARKTLHVFLFAAGLGVSTVSAAESSRPAAIGAAADVAFTNAARAAGAVFDATVLEVEHAPHVWSGMFAIYQTVTYRVTSVHTDRDHRLKPGDRVTVRHVLVIHSATADKEWGLRRDLVYVGAHVMVLADWRENQWTGVGERNGVVVSDAAHRDAIKRR